MATSFSPPRRSPANRLALDYTAEAQRLGPPAVPIFDAHLHINGPTVAEILRDVATLYGVSEFLTQTRLDHAQQVKELVPGVRFCAVPHFANPDRREAFGPQFLEHIRVFRTTFNAPVVKFWNAPRLRELLPPAEWPDFCEFDGKWRVAAAELATSLGMMFQAHVADPDTWFATKYADSTKYGTKRHAYESLERMVSAFKRPWIIAHMGGWPEDLSFLDGLLERHSNLYIDTSATKWIVREVSKHPRPRVLEFFTRWKGRLLFGSDIVTTDEHLIPKAAGKAHPMGDLADSPESASDLYASRYYALRTMWETTHEGPSNIVDPDLKMVDPTQPDDAAPNLRGFSLPLDILKELYGGAARRVLKEFPGITTAQPSRPASAT